MFWIDPDVICPVCGVAHSERTLTDWHFDYLDTTLRRVFRQDKDELEDRGTGESEASDDILEFELGLALLLSGAAIASGAAVLRIYDELTASRDVSQSIVDDVLERGDIVMRRTFDDIEDDVRRQITRAVNRGEGRIGRGLIRDVPSRATVIEGMVRSTGWFTNNYFNTQVMPAIIREVDKVLNLTDPMAVPNFTPIREALEQRLRSVPYWRTVGNAAASRSFHYGLLQAGQVQGFRVYRYSTIDDERRSEICTFLDGKEWQIATALALVERSAQANDIDEVKRIQPWLRFNDVKNLSDADLADRGVIVPPVHGNCRSWLTLI